MKPDKTLKALLVSILLALLANLYKPLLTPPPAIAQGKSTSSNKKAVGAIVTRLNATQHRANAATEFEATEWATIYDDGTLGKRFTVKPSRRLVFPPTKTRQMPTTKAK
jgi:hypothetical protein